MDCVKMVQYHNLGSLASNFGYTRQWHNYEGGGGVGTGCTFPPAKVCASRVPPIYNYLKKSPIEPAGYKHAPVVHPLVPPWKLDPSYATDTRPWKSGPNLI